jgi:hypothetical protein
MHLDDLDTLPPRAAIRIAADRRDVFDLLWLRRDLLRAALADAITVHADHDAPDRPVAEAFLARVLAHVRNADEYVALCTLLPEDLRSGLLWSTHKLHALDPRVLVTLLEDPTLLAALAPGPLWCSDALWTRAVWLFEEHPARRFTVAELVPAALPPDTLARAILGAALDGSRLTDDAVQHVRAMYPNDVYIQSRTAVTLGFKSSLMPG